MKKYIIFIALIVSNLTSFAQQKKEIYDPKKTFSLEELKADFAFLRKCLEEAHPGLNWYVSKDSLNVVFDNFEKSLTAPLTERQFRNQLFPVLAEIRCGHSSLTNSKERMKYLEKNNTKYIPFDIIATNTQLFIKENKSKDSTISKGTEILSINGEKSKVMLDKFAQSFMSDGYNQTHRYYTVKNNFQNWYPRLYEEKDSFALVLKDSLGRIQNVNLPCIDAKSFPFDKKNENKSAILFSNKKVNTFRLDDQNPKIGILKVGVFTPMGYWRLYRKTFKYIKKHNIEDLVLDLRGNGGGMIFHPGHLLSYLITQQEETNVYRKFEKPSFLAQTEGKGKPLNITYKYIPKIPKKWGVTTLKNDSIYKITIKNRVRTKNHYNGKLFILIDAGCFSATTLTAAYLKKNRRGLFIGEETGGGEKGCNAMVMNYLELPNSKLRYRFPFFRVEHDVTPEQVGRGIFPDVPIKYDRKARLQGRDLELEKVRLLVKSEKKN
jgi:Peptidase family S41